MYNSDISISVVGAFNEIKNYLHDINTFGAF